MPVRFVGALLFAALTLAAPVGAMQDSGASTAIPIAGDTTTHHTVVGGDTLWSLAEAFYGEPDLWVRLFEANRASVAGPDRLRPGQILEIPPAPRAAGAPPSADSPVAPQAPAGAAADPHAPSGAAVDPHAPAGAAADPHAPAGAAVDPNAPAGAPPSADSPVAPRAPADAAAVPAAPADPTTRSGSAARLATIAVGQGGSVAVVDASAPVPVRRADDAPTRSGPAAEGSNEAPQPEEAAVGAREATPIPSTVLSSAPLLVTRERAAGLIDSVASSPRLPRPGDRVGVELDALTFEVGRRVQSVRFERALDGGAMVAVPTAVLRFEGGSSDPPTARVEAVFGRVAPGDRLLPLPVADSVASWSAAVSSGPEITILATVAERPILQLGDWVFLDVGDATDVEVGDEFVPAWVADAERRPGRLQIVRLEGPYATARIVRLGGSIFEPGRTVRLDRRRR